MNFPSKVFLAPMAGITDVAFRDLAARCGAGLTTTELVSAQGLIQHNEQSQALIRRGDQEKNFAVQLFGSDPTLMAKATQTAQQNADYIDINAGCPVTKVVKTGAGSGLLTNFPRMSDILDAVLKVADVPVTVKMRLGMSNTKPALDFATLCEEKGVALLTVHGRTRDQMYGGKADWDTIQHIAQTVSIPVVGNGDITNAHIAKERLLITPHVSIGRGASGNPYLFTQCNDLLTKGSFSPHSFARQFDLFKDYLELAKQYETHFMHQLLQAQHFFKGIEGAAKFRLAVNSARSQEELLMRIEELVFKEKT